MGDETFSLQTLTASIQSLPSLPTRIGSSGLFAPKPQRSTQVLIDEEAGRLTLVPNASRRDPGVTVAGKSRKTRSFTTTHLPQRSVVLAEDIQGVRAFGSEDTLASVNAVVNDRLQDMKNNLVATREWQKIGAIKGQILNADGAVIEDLFSAFGVTQISKALALNVATTDVRGKIMAAKRESESVLGAFMVLRWKAYCSASFFDSLVGHDLVKATYAGWQASADRLGGDMRSGFTFGGTEFSEYEFSVGGSKYIADGEAYLVPDVPGLFVEALAPANYNETVNTMGQEYYAKAEPMPMGKGHNLEAQSNPLPLCLAPKACIKLTVS
ncbi:MAG TPA: major capsid protein [Fibrobacteria bacterium]|nr:major capsid protein [Fibrobacteria bacterium]